jgi:UDP-glucuronate decarboxylase
VVSDVPGRGSLPDTAVQDLTRLSERLDDAFRVMAGSDLLITGGAGFLGYYLVQAPLAWNRSTPGRTRSG